MTEHTAAAPVVIERTFDAPVDVVWRMWTDHRHFADWYGPNDATIPEATMDVRVGGKRRVCMRMATPNGSMEMWFTGEYREVDENRSLVYTESMVDKDGNFLAPADMGMPDHAPDTTEVVVALRDLGGRTQMTMTHRGVPADSPGAAGWHMAFEKLALLIPAKTSPT